MSKYAQLKRDLLFRVCSLPVSRLVSIPFITLVVKWVESSGEEWTIDRCKSIKLDIIRIKAGLSPVSVWIKSGKTTHFGGIIGTMEKIASSSDEAFNSIIQLTMVYSWFIAKEVTPQQSKKFLDGVHATPPPQDSLNLGKLMLDKASSLMGLRPVRFLPEVKPLVEFMPSINRHAPIPGSSVPEVNGVIDSLRYLWLTSKGRQHYSRFKSFYDNVMKGLDWWNTYLYKVTGPYGPMPNIDSSFLVGRIGLIQEPGYKLRAVANPGRVFQQVLKPFGDTLYNFLRILPWDCTFDQSKAVPVIQEALSRGCVVHSIDLSGATDYFPLEMQLHLLRKIMPHQYVELFSEISRGSWEMPGFGQVSWTRGQPLGLYPSFASFALTHGALLLGLKGEFNNSFFILGDDVVILDENLARDYLQFLWMIHCPVSRSKTIVSSELCEFAGRVITEKSVIPQFKWRTISDDSFIDLCRNLGPRAKRLLRVRQRRVIDSIESLPECLGGFGWNPQGLSLETRLNAHPWLWEPKEPRRLVTSYTGISIQNLFSSDCYTQTLKDTPSLVCSLSDDLDQRSIALTKNYLGNHLIPWYRLLGKNLDQVLADSDVCDLPIGMSRDPSSSLSVWERKLGLSH